MSAALATATAAHARPPASHVSLGGRRARISSPLLARDGSVRASRTSLTVSANGVREVDSTVIRQCALKKEGDLDAILKALDAMAGSPDPVNKAEVDGRWELVFSSFIKDVPLIQGYMPVREVVTFENVGGEGGFLRLDTDILFGLKMSMYPGDVFEWDEQRCELAFNLRRQEDGEAGKAKTWRFVYTDGEVLVGQSSGTGMNVLRRVD